VLDRFPDQHHPWQRPPATPTAPSHGEHNCILPAPEPLGVGPKAVDVSPEPSAPSEPGPAEHAPAIQSVPAPALATPVGGDVWDCLAASELDALLQPFLAGRYLTAFALFKVRTGKVTATVTADLIRARVEKHGWLLAPFHVAHHWATAFFTQAGPGTIETRIYDSAPSPHTRPDFQRVVDDLGFGPMQLVSHAKHPRGSNDCGLHVVWLAAMQTPSSRHPHLPAAPPSARPPVVSLRELRPIVAAAPTGLSKAVAQRILSAVPALQAPPGPSPETQPVDAAGGEAKPATTPRGFANPRAVSCFMNATLQGLATVGLSLPRRPDDLSRAIQSIRDGSTDPAPAPEHLRAVMKDSKDGGAGQQDAHEFLVRTLEEFQWSAKPGMIGEEITSVTGNEETRSETNTAVVSLKPAGDTLRSCIEAYEAPDYFKASDNKRNVKHAMRLAKPGEHIIFHISRFERTGPTTFKKVTRPINLPRLFAIAGVQFEVTAVVNHIGATPHSGHYTACIRRDGDWWLADDAKVTRLTTPDRHLNTAYLVFARRAHVPIRPATEPISVSSTQSSDTEAARTTRVREEQAAAKKRAAHDLKPGNFMHDSTVDALVAKMAESELRPVVYLNTDRTAGIVAAARKSPSPDWHKRIAAVRKDAVPGSVIVWLVCKANHFATVIARHGADHLELYDSLRPASRAIKDTAAEIAKAVAAIWGRPHVPAVREVDAPQQSPGSNDCARHALRAAWNQGATGPLPTRDQIVKGQLPQRKDATPPPHRAAQQSPRRVPVSQDGSTLVEADFLVDLGEIITATRFDKLRKEIASTLEGFAVKRKHAQKLVRVSGVSARSAMRHMRVTLHATTADVPKVRASLQRLVPDARIQTRSAEAPDQPAWKRNEKKGNPNPKPAERGTAERPTYTILEPGDARRSHVRMGWIDPDARLLLLRIENKDAKTIRCPLCKDDDDAFFTVDSAGPAATLRYHVKQQHGMVTRALQTVRCPCTDDPKHHCCALVTTNAAGQPAKSDGKRAFVPHHDAALCPRCGIWWGRRSKVAAADVHPCLPRAPGQYVEPWPLPEPVKRAPAGVATLTQSTLPAAEDPDHLVESQDFRSGEGQPRLGPLAEARVHSLTILTEADPNLAKAIVRKAFARETRLDHVRMLKSVGAAVLAVAEKNPDDPQLTMPVASWLIDWLKGQGRKHNWKWTTQNSAMSTLQSALKYLPTYVKHCPSWRLHEDTNWQLACRTCRTKAAAERPDQALPATTQQVHKACQFVHHTRPEVAMLLALTWVTFGRTSALIQLKREDISLEETTNGTMFTVTMMRGKSNRLGQDPHTVTGNLGDFEKFVTPIVSKAVNPKAFLIHAPSRQQRTGLLAEIRDALRNANNEQRLENRSLRRGSLQTLARAGASVSTLLACSGHSSVKSLKRYLNFGRVMTEDQRAATKISASLVKLDAAEQQSC
jgi:integrase